MSRPTLSRKIWHIMDLRVKLHGIQQLCKARRFNASSFLFEMCVCVCVIRAGQCARQNLLHGLLVRTSKVVVTLFFPVQLL